jgi:cation diffusion facilitator family transporter
MADHEHQHGTRWSRFVHYWAHDHDHELAPTADLGAVGIKATKVSLVGLGITAALQAVLVLVTGSVALLSDTIHNFTDALTAIPLWIAFALGRRPVTRRFTYGYHRAEDLAGVIIVVAILFSALAVGWESIRRLADPRQLDYVGLVIAAGIIGALGNELVARYRIRVGRRINSAALVADGQHARADALTSLAVVAAGAGSAVGWDWVDPVAGLAVTAMIVRLLWHTARNVLGRLLDAVDPEIISRIEATAAGTARVESVSDVQARHHGHRLLISVSVAVDGELTVAQGHAVSQDATHRLLHEFPTAVQPLVHVDPAGVPDAHESTAHHERPGDA